MVGLVNGIYKICAVISTIGAALVVLSIAMAGLGTLYSGGHEGIQKLKENIKTIILGSVCIFAAGGIGKEVISWFS